MTNGFLIQTKYSRVYSPLLVYTMTFHLLPSEFRQTCGRFIPSFFNSVPLSYLHHSSIVLMTNPFIVQDQGRKFPGGCGGAPETRYHGAHRLRLRRHPEIRLGACAHRADPSAAHLKFDLLLLAIFHTSLALFALSHKKFLKFIFQCIDYSVSQAML